jgi:hypothetical protein
MVLPVNVEGTNYTGKINFDVKWIGNRGKHLSPEGLKRQTFLSWQGK